MNNRSFKTPALLAMMMAVAVVPLQAEDGYVEPGSLRLSHELTLEGVFHHVSNGWDVRNNDVDKTFTKNPNANNPWTTEWGQTLLTEVATRLTPDVFGRVLFSVEGDYADRFWRPNNIDHHLDNVDRHVLFRQAEARIDKDDWYAHGFSGVGHPGWQAQGDFFELYPASFPEDDYLGQSGSFGIYPNSFRQDLFLNLSHDHAPQGFEGGVQAFGLDASVAAGSELTWGYSDARYARISAPLRTTKLTFVYRDENVPWAFDPSERNRAYALSWNVPSEQGHRFDIGILYQPFRLGDPYTTARDVSAGSGLLGSSVAIGEKTVGKKDAFAERLRLERHENWLNRVMIWSADFTHAGVVAGNKDQADLRFGTDIVSTLHGSLLYTYRRPLEGPVPFLYEGTPDNIGAVVSFPRGPESPFTVNWQNREAVFLTTTFVIDPTPGNPLFRYNPETLQNWNLSPGENAPIAAAVQYRISDYRGGTDRQYYYNASGDIVFEPAAHTGAWTTTEPIQEYRVMLHGVKRRLNWTAGIAGGETLAGSGLAYQNPPNPANKPITAYYSFEGRLSRDPFAVWGHYGSGVWGPEPYQSFFGVSVDRLWGVGVSYNITRQTKIETSYLAVRQGDFFVSPDVGSYDEIRMLFSHRFGFLFQFANPERPGYRAR